MPSEKKNARTRRFAALGVFAVSLAAAIPAALRRLAGRSEEERSALPAEVRGYTADGYIRDQDCFSAYTYRRMAASENSCGCIAAFNVRLAQGHSPSFSEVTREMDAMHRLPGPGPTHMYVMRRYLDCWLPGWRETHGRRACLAAAKGSGMGIFRYWETHVPHFVSYIRTPEGAFRFFNVCDGAEDRVFSMEEFLAKHCTVGPVRLLWWKARERRGA